MKKRRSLILHLHHTEQCSWQLTKRTTGSSSYFLGGYQELIGWLQYESVHKNQYDDFLMKLIMPVENKLILDDGCGNGRFSLSMAAFGADVVSLDINKRMAEEVNRKKYSENLVDKVIQL